MIELDRAIPIIFDRLTQVDGEVELRISRSAHLWYVQYETAFSTHRVTGANAADAVSELAKIIQLR